MGRRFWIRGNGVPRDLVHVRDGTLIRHHGYVSCSIVLLLSPLSYPPRGLLKRRSVAPLASERGDVSCVSWQLPFGSASLIARHRGWALRVDILGTTADADVQLVGLLRFR
jgi:hypothetical protein